MNELVFDITQEAGGGHVAVGENIVVQAETWNELRHNAGSQGRHITVKSRTLPAFASICSGTKSSRLRKDTAFDTRRSACRSSLSHWEYVRFMQVGGHIMLKTDAIQKPAVNVRYDVETQQLEERQGEIGGSMSLLKSAVTKLGQQLRTKLFADSQLLLGQMAAWQTRNRATISSLQDVEFKVFSQWGEDGILDWIIERAQLPPHLHTFVEFGVENYQEANTRFLLQNRNWRGLVLDGSTAAEAYLKSSGLALRFDITAKSAWITRDNINALIADAGFSGDIGLLSVDIDGNDYWVWEAIDAVRPVICVCEYNGVFGDLWPVSIPYEERFTRTLPKYSHLYFGASIAALRSLATKKGYVFLGTTLAGNDAFFIREDYASRVAGAIADIQAMPSKARESRDPAGKLSYAGGLKRLELLRDLPLIDVKTGATHTLRQLDPVYSKEWLDAMTSRSN